MGQAMTIIKDRQGCYFDSRRVPSWIAPCTTKEGDPDLCARSYWQVQDQNGVCIMQLGWHPSPQKARKALLDAQSNWPEVLTA